MRIFLAAGLSIVFAAALPAQFRGVGALGGSYASQGIARPLGGIGGPVNAFRFGPNQNLRGRTGRGRFGSAYAPFGYSVYVPSYFDTLDLADEGYYPPPAVVPPPGLAAPGNPPVIINQYFGAPAPPPDQGYATVNNSPYQQVPPPEQPQAAGANAPQPGEPIGPVQNYYLIAFKDHSVYPALAYWVEDNTLNYVTTQNTHNQASLNLIDLDLTKTLNQNRNVPFSIPGK